MTSQLALGAITSTPASPRPPIPAMIAHLSQIPLNAARYRIASGASPRNLASKRWTIQPQTAPIARPFLIPPATPALIQVASLALQAIAL